MIKYTYTQNLKSKARHDTLFYAVDLLTTNRNKSCCIDRSYIRKMYDYFVNLDDCRDKQEVKKIDTSYMKSWEKLHDSFLNYKRPEDLVVCYLSGPEPQNDFNELLLLGIHPQNIWAFESDTQTYQQAVQSYENLPFPQPKIVKGSIEQFFKFTPKKFDIIYIDSCGTISSNQHVLRIIASMFKFHRLNSPGIVITNFASPDTSNETEVNEYSMMMAQYLLFKSALSDKITIDLKTWKIQQLDNLYNQIKSNFDDFYSEFITRVLMDLPSVIIPSQRFVNSEYINNIGINIRNLVNKKFTVDEFHEINNNSIYKFLALNDLVEKEYNYKSLCNSKISTLIKEMNGLDEFSINIFNCMRYLYALKKDDSLLKPDIKDIKGFFDCKDGIYRFLDVTNGNLFFDLIINQMSYPMHYNTDFIKRYKYKAKKTNMYMDILVLDECRYIYEWLPTIHLIKNAFRDLSWQYTFRFALDGLVKKRLKYNNEYFFQGSVISKNHEIFGCRELNDRILME